MRTGTAASRTAAPRTGAPTRSVPVVTGLIPLPVWQPALAARLQGLDRRRQEWAHRLYVAAADAHLPLPLRLAVALTACLSQAAPAAVLMGRDEAAHDVAAALARRVLGAGAEALREALPFPADLTREAGPVTATATPQLLALLMQGPLPPLLDRAARRTGACWLASAVETGAGEAAPMADAAALERWETAMLAALAEAVEAMPPPLASGLAAQMTVLPAPDLQGPLALGDPRPDPAVLQALAALAKSVPAQPLQSTVPQSKASRNRQARRGGAPGIAGVSQASGDAALGAMTPTAFLEDPLLRLIRLGEGGISVFARPEAQRQARSLAVELATLPGIAGARAVLAKALMLHFAALLASRPAPPARLILAPGDGPAFGFATLSHAQMSGIGTGAAFAQCALAVADRRWSDWLPPASGDETSPTPHAIAAWAAARLAAMPRQEAMLRLTVLIAPAEAPWLPSWPELSERLALLRPGAAHVLLGLPPATDPLEAAEPWLSALDRHSRPAPLLRDGTPRPAADQAALLVPFWLKLVAMEMSHAL